ncbi:MAG: class I SAM-dependent methyltransferase, partial [Planctomycetes bacterium]|nr:class I SAM-dependent methyltransferase [Planctomycetota bacterium]
VRAQYEDFPYPPRDPADERNRLIPTHIDLLAKINHFCYAGGRDFRKNFRALVAGAGTGDSVIYLAEQLRSTNAHIVYLDISQASMAVAQERAKIRKLSNIEWENASILDLPKLGIAPFDYINCCGVLHHLANPDAGLKALEAVLAPGGAMGLMVYGTHGRVGVYQMQELLRRLNGDEPDMRVRIAEARALLEQAPPTNWFKRSESKHDDHIAFGDAGLYDLLLHSQDRAYTVDECYEFVEQAGMRLSSFAYLPYLYKPETFLYNPALIERLAQRTRREREAIAELLSGKLARHFFFAAREGNTNASLSDASLIPFFRSREAGDTIRADIAADGASFDISTPEAVFSSQATPLKRILFELIDGRRTIGEVRTELVTRLRSKNALPAPVDVARELAEILDLLVQGDLLFLRTRGSFIPEM